MKVDHIYPHLHRCTEIILRANGGDHRDSPVPFEELVMKYMDSLVEKFGEVLVTEAELQASALDEEGKDIACDGEDITSNDGPTTFKDGDRIIVVEEPLASVLEAVFEMFCDEPR